MEQCINFIDYEKISDDLMYFNQSTYLRFTVSLANRDINGCRKSFHREYGYKSKYVDKNEVLTIRRHFDFFMTIEQKNQFNNSIMVKMKDMMILKSTLKNVSKWFYDGTFKMKDGEIHIIKKHTKIYIPNFNGGKYIAFLPSVTSYDNGDQVEGIRMFLNDDMVYADMTIDTFMEFYYLIDNMDMYQCAIGLINYLGRPDFGFNLYKMDNGIEEYNPYAKPRFDNYNKKNTGKSFISGK